MTRPAAAEFDVDTALEVVADGLWRGRIDPSWYVATGPNGGFVAALATRALEQATARPARSLTLHYLAAPKEGPIDVACSVERSGRTTTFTSLRLTQHGEPVVLGLGAAAEWREGEPRWQERRPPEVPAPEEAPAVPADGPHVPVFLRKYEARYTTGTLGAEEPEGVTGGWLRAADGRPLDAPLIAAMVDAWLPPAFVYTGIGGPVPTVDLTIHFRSPVPAGAQWVHGTYRSRTAGGGVVDEDGELWSRSGVLLAQSRQLAVLRGRR